MNNIAAKKGTMKFHTHMLKFNTCTRKDDIFILFLSNKRGECKTVSLPLFIFSFEMSVVELKVPKDFGRALPLLLRDTFTEFEWKTIQQGLKGCFKDVRIRHPGRCENCLNGFAAMIFVLAVLVPIVIAFAQGPCPREHRGSWWPDGRCVDMAIFLLVFPAVILVGCGMCVCCCIRNTYGPEFQEFTFAERLEKLRRLLAASDVATLLIQKHVDFELCSHVVKAKPGHYGEGDREYYVLKLRKTRRAKEV